MQPEQAPFLPAWWAFDLAPYRPPVAQFATYTRYPYESLPPLELTRFRGDFHWLAGISSEVEAQMKPHQPDSAYDLKLKQTLQQLQTACGTLGVMLPPEFSHFMGAPALQHQIPSCTACYFSLSERPIPSPIGSGHLIRFLRDQQDCLIWYLYLNAQGDHCVVCADGDVGFMLEDEESAKHLDPEAIQGITYCAPSFEVFLYRFWLENTIWFALNEGGSLTAEMRVYLGHYQTSGSAPQ